MKKLLALLLIAILLVPALALSDPTPVPYNKFSSIFDDGKAPLYKTDIDLSGLSFEDLAALSTQCQAEMMTRDEWQQVTVPQGNYRVGVEIPAGKWVVRCADTFRTGYLMRETWISWGSEKPVDGFVPYPRKGEVEIYNPKNTNYNGGVTEYVIELVKGDWVAIHPQYNAAVCTPYTGNTGLGFK